MSIRFFLLSLSLIASFSAVSQESFKSGGGSVSFGDKQWALSINYLHTWKLGKSGNLQLSLGGRLTSYFGTDQYYTSAPASLAPDNSKTDSLFLPSAKTTSINAVIQLTYPISPKFFAGFNLDIIGYSFGATQNCAYITNGQYQAATGKPTAFNLLIFDKYDLGNLNSEFFLGYNVSERISIKLAFQHLFTEYTTDTIVQYIPESNDRFRRISNLVSVGASWRLRKAS